MPVCHSSPPIGGYAIDHRAGAMIAPHAHDRGQLSVVVKGTMTLTTDEGAWLAPPGLAVWIAPQILHSAQYSEASSLLQLDVSPTLAAQLPERCASIVVSDLLSALAREIVRVSSSEKEQDSLDLLAQLTVLQAQRNQNGPGLFVPHGRDRRLRLAIELMRQDPGADRSIDDVAAHACTSSRTLARLFVAETSMSFGRWREHLRIVCAINSLARGVSITQTAFELGYASTSSFTTLFTRLLGLPPRRYMLQLQSHHQTID